MSAYNLHVVLRVFCIYLPLGRIRIPLPASNMAEDTKSSPSLADRITKPAEAPSAPSTSWADDVPSPPASTVGAAENDAPQDIPQADGATEPNTGSALQEDNEFEVEVTLADLQIDKDSPLFSTQNFQELGM